MVPSVPAAESNALTKPDANAGDNADADADASVLPWAKMTETEKRSAIFNAFPDEVLLSILRHMRTNELLTLASVDRKWLSMCLESIKNVTVTRYNQFWSEMEDTIDANETFIRLFKSIRRNVSRLTVSTSKFNANALQVLGSAHKLRHLTLESIATGSRVFNAIGKAIELRKLELTYVSNMDIQCLYKISNLSNLQSLDISQSLSASKAVHTNLPLGAWFPHLESLTFHDSSDSEETISVVSSLNPASLRYLSLEHSRVVSDDVAQISRLTNLSYLSFYSSAHHSSQTMGFLTRLTSLSELSIPSSSALRDCHLANLGKMTDLHSLVISDCVNMQGSFLANASSSLTRLTRLVMTRSLNGAQPVDGLSLLTNLRMLEMSKCAQIPPASISHSLLQLTQLETLLVSGHPTLEDLQCVGKMDRLVRFDASDCPMLKTVPTLAKTVRELNLSSTGLSGDVFAGFSAKGQMNTLNLSHLPNLHPDTLCHFAGCSFIYHLEIRDTPVSKAAFDSLFASGCGVSSLNVANSPTFRDDMLEVFSKSSRLSTLDITNCPQLTPAGFKHLESVGNLWYVLTGGSNVTDSVLLSLASNKKLSTLVLQSCAITVPGIIAAFPSTHTCRIYIRGSEFTAAEKARLREANPKLSV